MASPYGHHNGQSFLQNLILARRNGEGLVWVLVLHSGLPAPLTSEADLGVDEASVASPVDLETEVPVPGQHLQDNEGKVRVAELASSALVAYSVLNYIPPLVLHISVSLVWPDLPSIVKVVEGLVLVEVNFGSVAH